MTKLVSTKFKKGEYANQDIDLPGVGVVKFNSDGSVDIPQEKVKTLLTATESSFGFVVAAVTEQDRVRAKEELAKAQQALEEADDQLKKQQVAEVLGKGVATNDQLGAQSTGETTTLVVENKEGEIGEDPILTQLKADLAQADMVTLLELAGDTPELAEKDLTGYSDVQLREELAQAMYKPA